MARHNRLFESVYRYIDRGAYSYDYDREEPCFDKSMLISSVKKALRDKIVYGDTFPVRLLLQVVDSIVGDEEISKLVIGCALYALRTGQVETEDRHLISQNLSHSEECRTRYQIVEDSIAENIYLFCKQIGNERLCYCIYNNSSLPYVDAMYLNCLKIAGEPVCYFGNRADNILNCIPEGTTVRNEADKIYSVLFNNSGSAVTNNQKIGILCCRYSDNFKKVR